MLGEGRTVVDPRPWHEAHPGQVPRVLAQPTALLVEPEDGDPGPAEGAGDRQAGDVGVHHQRRDPRQVAGDDLLSGEREHPVSLPDAGCGAAQPERSCDERSW